VNPFYILSFVVSSSDPPSYACEKLEIFSTDPICY